MIVNPHDVCEGMSVIDAAGDTIGTVVSVSAPAGEQLDTSSVASTSPLFYGRSLYRERWRCGSSPEATGSRDTAACESWEETISLVRACRSTIIAPRSGSTACVYPVPSERVGGGGDFAMRTFRARLSQQRVPGLRSPIAREAWVESA